MSDEPGITEARNRPRGRKLLWGWILGGFLASELLVFLLSSSIQNNWQRHNLTYTQRSFGGVANALNQYHAGHQHFPAPDIMDSKGQALLSWRVAILPMLEERILYEKFKLEESWDGMRNAELIRFIPMGYVLAGGDVRSTLSHFQVFVGPGAAFEHGKTLRMPDDFPDGLSKTILVAEAAEAVPWTKPADLAYHPGRPLPPLGAVSKEGFCVAMADGSARFVSHKISESTLRALITRNGQDLIGTDWKD